MRRLFLGLKLIWVAIKYRWSRMKGGSRIGGVRISLLKLGFVILVVFLVSQKDIRFAINLKAPLSRVSDQGEGMASRTSSLDKLGLADALPFASNNRKEETAINVEDLDPGAVQAYIKRFSKVAVAEMRKFGMPASIKMAQGILESQAGQVALGAENNHFGLPMASDEYISAWENWRAHSIYLKKEYADLFEIAFGYKQWAKALEQRGYNKDRKYAEKLIEIIEKYGLDQLDE